MLAWNRRAEVAARRERRGCRKVEVVSASEKVHDYLAAGTPLVWVVYPRTHGDEDVLEGFGVLPGFRCAVAELFR